MIFNDRIIRPHMQPLMGMNAFNFILQEFFTNSNPKFKCHNNYPITDTYADKDGNQFIEMALAGYTKADVKVEVTDGVLSIRGTISKEAEDYVYRGISKRAFAKQLQLSEYVECKGAKLEDGMLKVELEYNPPEDKKAKHITVK